MSSAKQARRSSSMEVLVGSDTAKSTSQLSQKRVMLWQDTEIVMPRECVYGHEPQRILTLVSCAIIKTCLYPLRKHLHACKRVCS